MRRAAVDANQPAIVRALRCMGFTVQHLHGVGKGCPDLLCGWRGETHLIEVKDGDKAPSARRLTDDQEEWHAAWRGAKPVILTSVEEAIAWAGKLERAE